MEERRFPSSVTGPRERAPFCRELICFLIEDIVISFRFEGSRGGVLGFRVGIDSRGDRGEKRA